ncbi:MAG: hypothetical protein IIA83_01375 [Thaumarchaeota archaeon]|nr:hypothetical protein [Nitrososphaerota archaeon]
MTEKIQKYHEKKLNDALQELQFHQEVKKRLETNLKTTDDESRIGMEEEIDKEDKIIDIWRKNIEKINEQLKKLKN